MKFNWFKLGISSVLITTSLFYSCSKENDDSAVYEELNSNTIPKEVLIKAEELGLKQGEFDFRKITLPNQSIKEVITIDDMVFEKERFLNTPIKGTVSSKQYRSEFLVDTDKHSVINIYAYVGQDAYGLSTAAQESLKEAIKIWNDVSTKIQFEIDYGTDLEYDENYYEIGVSVDTTLEGFAGMAEFPYENGDPGKFVVISTEHNQRAGETNFDFEGSVHQIAHEFGHTIGFRHSDWNTRRSCGEFSPEPRAIRITGTQHAFNFQPNSLMNACFVEPTGKLNFWDKRGLQKLYNE